VGHVVKEMPWGVIDIVTDEGRVFFLERWNYKFELASGVTAKWTDSEKRRFHRNVQVQIWRTWSLNTKLSVTGNAGFAKKFAAKKVPVTFAVAWTVSKPHWTVVVQKLPPGSDPTTFISNVDRAHMQINLDSADILKYTPSNAAGASRDFQALPHEFGHTFPGVDDEYVAGAPNLADTNSIMNIGDEVRARHLQPLVDALNTMIPDCTFSAA
jgi:hypothetical protein